MTHENTLKKARIVADIVVEHYEAGRQDRCLEWVYRNVVNVKHPMSLRTFQRYIKIATNELNYSFTNKDENKEYLFDMYAKMQPETEQEIEEVSKEVLRVKSNGESKKSVYVALKEQIGLTLSFGRFNQYLLVAEHCMNYKFNF